MMERRRALANLDLPDDDDDEETERSYRRRDCIHRRVRFVSKQTTVEPGGPANLVGHWYSERYSGGEQQPPAMTTSSGPSMLPAVTKLRARDYAEWLGFGFSPQ